MIALQNMVCSSFPRKVYPSDPILQASFVLLYTLISILILHNFRKSARIGYVIMSILGDIVFIGFWIAILSIYSFTGVPADCGSLTRENFNPNPPSPHRSRNERKSLVLWSRFLNHQHCLHLLLHFHLPSPSSVRQLPPVFGTRAMLSLESYKSRLKSLNQ